MKLIDRYILLQFIKNFVFGIVCFVIIFILVDLFENLDKFIDKDLGFSPIFFYYMTFIPEILKLITPVGMLLATLFTISKFNNYSEMTALNSSGISIYRFSLPIILFGILITLASIYFNGYIVPEFNSKKFNFERNYLGKNQIAGVIQNMHIQESSNSIIFIGSYNEALKTGTNTSIQIFDKNNLSKLNFRFDSKIMKWDSIRNDWKLIQVTERKFDSSLTQDLVIFDSVYASVLPEIGKLYLTPTQIKNNQLKPDELKLNDLKYFINTLEESGQNVSKAKVDYYSKISFPFANIVVILFGISLGINKRKSGAAIQFAVSIFIAFIYLGFIKISQTFGYNGEMNPILTAWLANITFLMIALLNIMKANLLKS